MPADYYSSPATDVRPLFPRWVPIGCGIAAAVILLLVFVGGALVVRFGMGRAMGMVIGSMTKELGEMYAADVPAVERKALEDEMSRLRTGLTDETISPARLDKVMGELREAIKDQKITRDEAKKLTSAVHEVNIRKIPPSRPRP